MGPQLPACPAVSYHLITATWPKHRRASPSRPDKYAYLGGEIWTSSLSSSICFKCFWGKLCIKQGEILCCVTYSVQFKVPLFLLSAGVGSHRGAIQSLHRRWSNCRGDSKGGIIMKSEYLGSYCARWIQRERKHYFYFLTTPNHKVRDSQQGKETFFWVACSCSRGGCSFRTASKGKYFFYLRTTYQTITKDKVSRTRCEHWQ